MDPIFQNPAYLAQILTGADIQQLATLIQQGPPEIKQAALTELQRRQGGGQQQQAPLPAPYPPTATSLRPEDMVQPPPGGQMMPPNGMPPPMMAGPGPSPMAPAGQAMGAGAMSQMPGGMPPQQPMMPPQAMDALSLQKPMPPPPRISALSQGGATVTLPSLPMGPDSGIAADVMAGTGRKPTPPGEPGLVPTPVSVKPRGMFGKTSGMLSEIGRAHV